MVDRQAGRPRVDGVVEVLLVELLVGEPVPECSRRDRRDAVAELDDVLHARRKRRMLVSSWFAPVFEMK